MYNNGLYKTDILKTEIITGQSFSLDNTRLRKYDAPSSVSFLEILVETEKSSQDLLCIELSI